MRWWIIVFNTTPSARGIVSRPRCLTGTGQSLCRRPYVRAPSLVTPAINSCTVSPVTDRRQLSFSVVCFRSHCVTPPCVDTSTPYVGYYVLCAWLCDYISATDSLVALQVQHYDLRVDPCSATCCSFHRYIGCCNRVCACTLVRIYTCA